MSIELNLESQKITKLSDVENGQCFIFIDPHHDGFYYGHIYRRHIMTSLDLEIDKMDIIICLDRDFSGNHFSDTRLHKDKLVRLVPKGSIITLNFNREGFA